MVRYRALPAVALAAVLATCLVTSQATAASWDSFKEAVFSDIVITPELQGGTTVYQLAMGTNPTVTFGGNTYDVNWIQGVYAVGVTQATSFTATEGTNSKGWGWDYKSTGGTIAGYHGTGSNRLYPSETMDFSYATLVADPDSMIPGFHLAYQDGGDQKTDWFKGETLPEPSTLLALATPLVGCIALMRRRLRR